MRKEERDKIMLAEHTLEVRHAASGTLLDNRGYIADYIRTDEKFLRHWKIDTNVVNFHDAEEGIEKEGAFVGYKSAGYIVLNPPTRNYFADRATAFWKILLKNKFYEIPEPTRFGARTKVFIPSNRSFEEINGSMFQELFTEKARNLIGEKETDLKLTIMLKESGFEVLIHFGPLHKDEARRYFQLKSDEFKKCGLFMDFDYYKSQSISLEAVPKLLQEAMNLMWQKADRIAASLGL